MRHGLDEERGFTLVTALLVALLVFALLAAYSHLTLQEMARARATMASTRGFYAAEAGLNLRAKEVRQIFEDYNVPSGTSPAAPAAGDLPCEVDQGAGDYECEMFAFGRREARTYMSEDDDNPVSITIPPGERFAGLTADEYRFGVNSMSVGPEGHPETILEMRYKTRLVPVFQFFAFYDKDLEYHPGPRMTVEGPVHANGDLFLDANDRLSLDSLISTAGALYRGLKFQTSCQGGTVRAHDGDGYVNMPSCAPNRLEVTDRTPWNGRVHAHIEPLEVPPVEDMDPLPGRKYWDKADVRIMLHIDDFDSDGDIESHERRVEVRRPDNTVDGAATERLTGTSDGTVDGQLTDCPGRYGNGDRRPPAVHFTNKWTYQSSSRRWKNSNGNKYKSGLQNWRNRQNGMIGVGIGNSSAGWVEMLEIDLRRLLQCIVDYPEVMDGRELDDDTEGGLVFYMGIDGPLSAQPNNYGFRVSNAGLIRALDSTAPVPRGLTFVSDQAAYSWGDYNDDIDNADTYVEGDPTWTPSAFLVDTMWVLSNDWEDDDYSNKSDKNQRRADDTAVRAAFLAGTPRTGGADGPPGQDQGSNSQSGGLHNYPRFLEKWSGDTARIQTSFVSFSEPRHNPATHKPERYSPPIREWSFDVRFRDPARLPPMTPRAVYNRQEMFARHYEY